MKYKEFYNILFAQLEKQYGVLDEDTITSIVGFSAGGPVSIRMNNTKKLYVTCELAVYHEQRLSVEGLKFELFSIGQYSDNWCRSVFTEIGRLSLTTELGDQHTIEVSDLIKGPEAINTVRLRLFSQASINGQNYGLYEVVPAYV